VSTAARGPVRHTHVLGLLVAAGAVVAGVALPPPAGVERDVQLVLSVFAATVVLWVVKPVPYAVSSLLCVILLYGSGVAGSFRAAVGGFASTLVFFFLLLYLISTSIAKVDLDEWFARRLVSTTTTPRSSVRRLASTILLLAFVMPSGFARTVTFMPIVDQVNDLYDLDDDSPFRRFGYYLLGHVNPILSMSLMTSGGMAVVTAELINDMVRSFTWVEWAVYMAPPVIVLYIGCLVAALRLIGVDDALELADRPTPDGGDPVPDARADHLTRDQRIVVVTMTLATAAWIVGSFVGVSAIVPAMAVVFVYALPGVGIITAEDISDISWGIVFLLGAMLSLLDVMRSVDALDRIVDAMVFVVPSDGPTVVAFAAVFGVAIGVRAAFSSSAATFVVLFPIVLEFAEAFGFDPLFTALGLMVVMMTTVPFPFNLAPVLVAYDEGPLSLTEVFGLGLLTLSLAVVVVVGSWAVYWPFVDGLLSGVF
jgi:anion transporter